MSNLAIETQRFVQRDSNDISYGTAYGILDLATMIRIYGEKILLAMATMHSLTSFIRGAKSAGMEVGLTEKAKDAVREDLRKLSPLFAELPFPISKKQGERIAAILESDPGQQHYDVVTCLGIFCNTVHDELEQIVLLAIPAEKRTYYIGEKGILPENVLVRFPSVALESEEARKCYAIGRPTACVFHSMRILEIGLIALARALNVQSEHRNWEPLIGEIEATMRQIGPTNGAQWRDDLKFYSEAVVPFRHFKDAWRNHVMHIRDSYNDDAALFILQSVNRFMEYIAGRLSENP